MAKKTEPGTKIFLGKDYVMADGSNVVNFKCECGCTVLEEVMGGVTHSSNISSVTDEGDAVYGLSSQDGGEVEAIQCRDCGKKIADSLPELVEHYRNALFPNVKK